MQDEIQIGDCWKEIEDVNDFVNLNQEKDVYCSAYFSVKNNLVNTFILTYTKYNYVTMSVALNDKTYISDYLNHEADFLPTCAYLKRKTTVEGLPPKSINCFET